MAIRYMPLRAPPLLPECAGVSFWLFGWLMLILMAGPFASSGRWKKPSGWPRFKAPKTAHGRRTISLPSNAIPVLREHRRNMLEIRLALGLGKPDADTLLFGKPDGSPMRPNQLSWLWRSACKSLKLPRVSFHALRHTHASALIAAGLDVVAISRRLGHANPTVTLNIYGHLFKKDDSAAAKAIDAVMR